MCVASISPREAPSVQSNEFVPRTRVVSRTLRRERGIWVLSGQPTNQLSPAYQPRQPISVQWNLVITNLEIKNYLDIKKWGLMMF